MNQVQKATRDNKFKGPVLGPIGSFIKIEEGKERYAQLAELALNFNTLDKFVITNDHDRKVFNSIRKEARCEKDCAIFQVNPGARFTVPPPPAPEIETVASVLQISNDIIFNALVDFCRIDQMALAPNREVSEEKLLLKDKNGRYSIKGNFNTVMFLPVGDSWSVRNGSLSLASNTKQLRRSIGVDKSAAIEEAQKEVSQLQEEHKELKKEEAAASKVLHDAKVKWNVAKQKDIQNKAAIKKLERKIDDIKQEMETTENVDMDTTDLEEEVAQAEQEVEEVEHRIQQLVQEIEAAQPVLDEIISRRDEVAARNAKVLEDMEKAEEALQAIVQMQSQKSQVIEKKRQKLEQLSEIVTKHRAAVAEREEEKERALRKARKVTLRLKKQEDREDGENDENEPPSQATITEEQLESVEIRKVEKEAKWYEAKVQRAKEKIEKERNRRQLTSNDDPVVAYENYTRAKEDLDNANHSIEEINIKLHQTNKDLKQRRKRWKSLQDYLALKTNEKFDNILHLNSNSGSLEFDHETHELNLIVQKDQNDVNSQTKDVKALRQVLRIVL